MNYYGLLVGPYFLGLTIITAALALIAIWSGRATWIRMFATTLSLALVYFIFVAVDDLLSRPKPITFDELQSQLPEGHPGNLVLYGEVTENGIFLLLRSPAYSEPRYFFLAPKDKDEGKKMKEDFEKAQREAKKKNTQLLLGGKGNGNGDKDNKGDKDNYGGKGKKGNDRAGVENVEMDSMFHSTPVSGVEEKTPEQPVPPVQRFVPSTPPPQRFPWSPVLRDEPAGT